jgi:isoquinoline 1-oxidoreductase alpha subunit
MVINGNKVDVPDEWREASLLEFLRDYLGLTGSKYGCGIGVCGACTVHVGGDATRSCQVPVSSLNEQDITTIEGLGTAGQLHPVQQAWRELAVPQCGYCQSGQMMTAAAYLASVAEPDEDAVSRVMSSVLCRCGTYTRIRAGVARAAELAREVK